MSALVGVSCILQQNSI